jgi:hypothetical protein
MDDVGTRGIVKDLDDHSVALEAWTDGKNVRFNDNTVIKFLGDQIVFDTPQVPPYFAMPVQDADSIFWIYAGLSKVFTFGSAVHTNITRVKTSPEFEVPQGNLAISTSVPSVYPGVNRDTPLVNLTITTTAPSVVVA